MPLIKISKTLDGDDMMSIPDNYDDVYYSDEVRDGVDTMFTLSSSRIISNIFSALDTMVDELTFKFYDKKITIDSGYSPKGTSAHMVTTLYACNFESYYVGESDDPDMAVEMFTIRASDIWKVFRQNKNVNDLVLFEYSTDEDVVTITINHWTGVVSRYTIPAFDGKNESPEVPGDEYQKEIVFSLQTFSDAVRDIGKFSDMLVLSLSQNVCTMSTPPGDRKYKVTKELCQSTGDYFRVQFDNDTSTAFYLSNKVSVFLAPKKCFTSVKAVFVSWTEHNLTRLRYRLANMGDLDIYLMSQ